MANDKKTLTPEEVAAKKETAEKAAKEKAELEAKAKADQEAQEAKELAEKEASDKAAQDKSKKQDKQSSTEKLVEKYRKSYPDNKVFYVTSDMQLFLESDQNMAILHQKTLKTGELETVKF